MPVSFRILPAQGVVYVRYDGFARLDETFEAFGRYASHPDASPGQKQLVDLAGITDYERDFTTMMKLQARKADTFVRPETQTMVVYHAPTAISLEMSELVIRSWDDVSGVVACVQQSEHETLALLGLSGTSFSEILERAN